MRVKIDDRDLRGGGVTAESTIARLEDVHLAGSRGEEALRGVSVGVQRGEIVGIAGVSGNGQSALVEVLTGQRPLAAGVLLAGAEVLGIVAVAVMGKPGYAYIKNHVFGFLKQYGPPADVGRTRYKVGLVMFAVPIVFGWLAPYATDLIPGYLGNEFTYAIVGDMLLLTSLFVLGGDFWDKLRALFIREAKAVFPKTAG